MTNKKIWIALIIAFAFGFMAIGCPDISPENKPSPSPSPIVNVFNGTWVSTNEYGNVEKMVLNENDFEIFLDDEKQVKGTFTITPINNVTLTMTHYYGDALNEAFDEENGPFMIIIDILFSGEQKAVLEEIFNKITFTSKYYNEEEIKAVINEAFSGVSESDYYIQVIKYLVDGIFEEMFTPLTGTATPGVDIAGNLTLTITIDDETTVYTKQPQ